MNTPSLAALLFVVLCAVPVPASAQARNGSSDVLPHALNPSMSLSGPVKTPLQQQMREDYATNLRIQQRDLLQQNPSGLTRPEMAIGHELNSYMSPR